MANDIDLGVIVNDDSLFQSLNRLEKELIVIDKTADKTGNALDAAFKGASKEADKFTKEVKQADKALEQTGKGGENVGKGLLKGLRGVRMEMRLFNTIPGVVGMATGAFQKITDAVDLYNETFNSTSAITKRVSEATADVVNEYGKERSRLNDLRTVLEGDVATRKQKQQAIEELQKINPEVFKDLTVENALTKESAENYQKAREQLEALAKAKIREQIIGELRVDAVKKELDAAKQAQLVSGSLSEQIVKNSSIENLLLNNIISSFQTASAETARAAIDFAAIDSALEKVFATTNDIIDNTNTGATTTKEGITNLLGDAGKATAKQTEENKILKGSIADIQEQLSKVNDQIERNTKANDTEALTPLVEKANELEKQLKAANDQLELLRTPANPLDALKNLGSVGEVTEIGINAEDRLNQELALADAKLKQQQAADLLLLKQKGATEEQLTELQAKQELDRQRLALETEQKRVEFILKYGDTRTDAETETVKAQLAAIKDELAAFSIEAKTAVEGETGRKSFFELLGLDPNTEEGAAAIEGIKQGVSYALEQLGSFTDAQKALADAEVQRRNDNLSRLQQDLANQLQLNQQGFASDISLTQRKIQEEKKARAIALEDQRRATMAQLVLDTALQAGNLITASSQIFSSFAGLPFGIGIPIAATVIAAMIGSFIAAKVQSFKAVKLNKGGQLPTTFEGGRSDEGSGAGHRIEDTNYVVGGGEYITNAKTTEEHLDFLERLNSDQYKGMDLVKVIEGKKGRVRAINQAVAIIAADNNQRAIEAQTDALKAILEQIRDKPEIVGLGENSYIKLSKTKNGTKTEKINLK